METWIENEWGMEEAFQLQLHGLCSAPTAERFNLWVREYGGYEVSGFINYTVSQLGYPIPLGWSFPTRGFEASSTLDHGIVYLLSYVLLYRWETFSFILSACRGLKWFDNHILKLIFRSKRNVSWERRKLHSCNYTDCAVHLMQDN